MRSTLSPSGHRFCSGLRSGRPRQRRAGCTRPFALSSGPPGAVVVAPGDVRGSLFIPGRSGGVCCGIGPGDGPNMACGRCRRPVATRNRRLRVLAGRVAGSGGGRPRQRLAPRGRRLGSAGDGAARRPAGGVAGALGSGLGGGGRRGAGPAAGRLGRRAGELSGRARRRRLPSGIGRTPLHGSADQDPGAGRTWPAHRRPPTWRSSRSIRRPVSHGRRPGPRLLFRSRGISGPGWLSSATADRCREPARPTTKRRHLCRVSCSDRTEPCFCPHWYVSPRSASPGYGRSTSAVSAGDTVLYRER